MAESVDTRYYCKNCKSEFNPSRWVCFDETHVCPHCCCPDNTISVIPAYETVQQHEKRTGNPHSDKGIVWVKNPYGKSWTVIEYDSVKRIGDDDPEYLIVYISSPFPPPDDWRPE